MSSKGQVPVVVVDDPAVHLRLERATRAQVGQYAERNPSEKTLRSFSPRADRGDETGYSRIRMLDCEDVLAVLADLATSRAERRMRKR